MSPYMYISMQGFNIIYLLHTHTIKAMQIYWTQCNPSIPKIFSLRVYTRLLDGETSLELGEKRQEKDKNKEQVSTKVSER